MVLLGLLSNMQYNTCLGSRAGVIGVCVGHDWAMFGPYPGYVWAMFPKQGFLVGVLTMLVEAQGMVAGNRIKERHQFLLLFTRFESCRLQKPSKTNGFSCPTTCRMHFTQVFQGFCLVPYQKHKKTNGFCLVPYQIYKKTIGFCLVPYQMYKKTIGVCLVPYQIYKKTNGFGLVPYQIYKKTNGFCLVPYQIYKKTLVFAWFPIKYTRKLMVVDWFPIKYLVWGLALVSFGVSRWCHLRHVWGMFGAGLRQV